MNHVLQGSWFYLADNRIESRRIVYNVLNLASEIGGMAKVIFSVIGVFGCYINAQFINSKMIRSLYFLPKYNDEFEDKNTSKNKLHEVFNNFKNQEYYKSIQTIRFSTCDKFHIYSRLSCLRNKKNKRLQKAKLKL